MLINVNVSWNITNYRFFIPGIRQNKKKCLIFFVLPRGTKKSYQIRTKGRGFNPFHPVYF